MEGKSSTHQSWIQRFSSRNNKQFTGSLDYEESSRDPSVPQHRRVRIGPGGKKCETSSQNNFMSALIATASLQVKSLSVFPACPTQVERSGLGAKKERTRRHVPAQDADKAR